MLPHVGIVATAPEMNPDAHVVHNMGRGTEESAPIEFSPYRAVAHYRWPVRG